MSRGLSATNLAEIAKDHVHEVRLVKLEFDAPVYIHSGIGTITYDTNDYLGVGDLGKISNTTERLDMTPSSLSLSLNGVDAGLVSEALDAGNFGDEVTLYFGFRGDDGLLIADPEVEWRGYYDHASSTGGSESVITIICQHDLAVLSRNDGSRFSDEDQRVRHTGDTGFEFVADPPVNLWWGGNNLRPPRGKDPIYGYFPGL